MVVSTGHAGFDASKGKFDTRGLPKEVPITNPPLSLPTLFSYPPLCLLTTFANASCSCRICLTPWSSRWSAKGPQVTLPTTVPTHRAPYPPLFNPPFRLPTSPTTHRFHYSPLLLPTSPATHRLRYSPRLLPARHQQRRGQRNLENGRTGPVAAEPAAQQGSTLGKR